MDTVNNKVNLAQSLSDEQQSNTFPIYAPLPPPSKFQTPSHKDAFNGTPKIFASPSQQNANLHSSGAELASKSRLITDFLPRVGQVAASKDRQTNVDNTPSSTVEERRTHNETPGKMFQVPLTCHRCGTLYPVDNNENIPAPIHNQWECQACTFELREKLILELKENARFKALEREKRELQKKQDRDAARIKREQELQQRREAKEQEKEQIRIKRAEQAQQRIVDDNDATNNNSSKKIVIQTNLPYAQGPIQLIQTTIKVDKKKSRAKPEQPLTPAERQKLEERKLIKQQLLIFSKLYPELVEKNSIKYPIEDGLITKLPELHGATQLKPKPTPHKVLLSGEEFDRLLYIWEFFNNFSEYLEIPQFKIEDLKIALTYVAQDETSVVEEEEMEWALQMRLKHIRDRGFHLVNSMFTALVSRYLGDMFSSEEEQSENLNQILLSIHKLISDKETYWSEIIRLLLIQRAGSNNENAFGQSSDTMKDVIQKLSGLTTKDFNSTFNYAEKIALLTSLIDGIHELQQFRDILNQRIEERTQYNKEKMEIYAQIKELEKEQADINKKLNDQEILNQQQAIDKELSELALEVSSANRAEGRKIKERINQLRQERSQFDDERVRVEDAIKRKHAQIVKINEKSFKCSIRTSMLGKDANKVEYWHFKDDSQRIYTRVEQQVLGEIDQLTGARQVVDCQYNWFYYDEEDQYEQLVENLNPKGIRERKLQENLRKIKERLKLKKSKKTVPQEDKPDVVMEREESESVKHSGQHLVFENDNYEESLNYAVWFGKKVPPKRRIFGRMAQKQAFDEQSDPLLSLEQVKKKLVEIATNYMLTSAANDREWTDKATTEQWLNNVNQCTETLHLRKLIMQLDDGMSLPTALLKKEDKIQRFRLQLFKFWPSQDLHDAFRKYTQSVDNNLLAVSISVEILDKINEQFVVRQNEKALKLTKKAAEAKTKDGNKKLQAPPKPFQRGSGRGEYVKYFDSSESSEEESSEQEEEEKSEQSEFITNKAPVKGKKLVKLSAKDSSYAKESVEDESSEQESEDTYSREWDEYCYICDDGGNVICCDGCSNVAHLSCLKMKQQPKDEWYCNQCLIRIAQQRVTRGKTTELTKKSSVKSGRRRGRRPQ